MTPFGWRISHDPTANGLTILIRHKKVHRKDVDAGRFEKCVYTWGMQAGDRYTPYTEEEMSRD